MKSGFIVYLISDESVVARYAGDTQTPEEILMANGFDNTHRCLKFRIPEGHSVDDYIVTADAPALAAGADQNILNRKASSEFGRKVTKLLLSVNLDQENRLRSLEGQPAITAPDYRAQLIAQYKAIN